MISSIVFVASQGILVGRGSGFDGTLCHMRRVEVERERKKRKKKRVMSYLISEVVLSK